MTNITLKSWHRCSIIRYNNYINSNIPNLIQHNINPIATEIFDLNIKPNKNKKTKLLNTYSLKINTGSFSNHFIHIQNWNQINTALLHCCSKKLLIDVALYSGFSTSLNILGLLTPRRIYSKTSISNYKLVSGTLIGSSLTMRSQKLWLFNYKMAFLSAQLKSKKLLSSQEQIKLPKETYEKNQLQHFNIGVNNIFIIPELEYSDYDLYSKIPGFDINYNTK